jgi:hypothetical protein
VRAARRRKEVVVEDISLSLNEYAEVLEHVAVHLRMLSRHETHAKTPEEFADIFQRELGAELAKRRHGAAAGTCVPRKLGAATLDAIRGLP